MAYDLVPNLALKQVIEEYEKTMSNPWFLKQVSYEEVWCFDCEVEEGVTGEV